MDARRILLALAWVATAVVAGVLADLCLRGPYRGAPVGRSEGAGSEGNLANGAPAPRGRASTPEEARLAPARASVETAHPEKDASSGPVVAWIEPDVRTAEGGEVDEGVVYVLPAGGEGVWEANSVPNAHVPYEHRIPLTVPGSYDVGYADGQISTMATDVRVRKGELTHVNLRLPPVARAPLVFRWAEASHAPPSGTDVALSLRSPQVTQSDYPGRNAGPLRTGNAVLDGSRTSVSVDGLVEGASYEVWASVREHFLGPQDVPSTRESMRYEVEVTPKLATPGDTVLVRLAPLVPLQITFDVADDAWPDAPPSFTLELEQAARTVRRDYRFAYLYGFRRFGGSSDEWGARPGPAVLRWKGFPILAGEIDLVVPESAPLKQTILLRCDPRVSNAAGGVAFHVRGGPTKPPEGVSLDLYGRGASEGDSRPPELHATFEPGEPRVLPAVWRLATSILATFGERWVSDPTPMPERGELEISLRPAGSLVVAVDPLPDNAGEIRLRRADGEPIAQEWEPDSYETEISVGLGSVLQYLPEGEHTFQVTVGGVRWPDVVAKVRGGVAGVLRIRP